MLTLLTLSIENEFSREKEMVVCDYNQALVICLRCCFREQEMAVCDYNQALVICLRCCFREPEMAVVCRCQSKPSLDASNMAYPE